MMISPKYVVDLMTKAKLTFAPTPTRRGQGAS